MNAPSPLSAAPPPRRSSIPEGSWPRGMKAAMAAAYVGLSETVFRQEVAKDARLQPTWITRGRQIWLKDQLDTWLDAKAGLTPQSKPAEGETGWGKTWDDEES